MRKHWTFRSEPKGPVAIDTARTARKLGVSELTITLLQNRGVHDPAEMDIYLTPSLGHLCQPHTIPGLEEAVSVLAKGIAEGKPFAVWGDYDVDGVTSSALVIDFMRQKGIEAVSHIPNRMEEGYGLNVEYIKRLYAQGIRLLLTVDCGITSHEPIAKAKELGMDVVVSDHHLPHETLPPAKAICDPQLEECPCANLAGVGVAFFLMAALNKRLPGNPLDMRQFLDLVALGTLADVVKLQGVNRILTKNGMLLIKNPKRPGMRALKTVAGHPAAAALGAGQIVFGLAPRINAAGRLGKANDALDLMLSPNLQTAEPLAQALDTMNQERKLVEEQTTEAAMRQALTQLDNPGLVLFDPNWHQGVIGIVASRVVEKHYRPTLILTQENGELKGSGRSISEVDLHQTLVECRDVLTGFGGHRQAAGLRLKPDMLPSLTDFFGRAVVKQAGKKPLHPTLKLDAELSFAAIDLALLKEIECMQPFGMGNPEPVFASPLVKVSKVSVFSKGHLMLHLHDENSGRTLRAKAWRMAETWGVGLAGQHIRVAFTPKIDTFHGIDSINLTIKDIQPENETAWRPATGAAQ